MILDSRCWILHCGNPRRICGFFAKTSDFMNRIDPKGVEMYSRILKTRSLLRVSPDRKSKIPNEESKIP